MRSNLPLTWLTRALTPGNRLASSWPTSLLSHAHHCHRCHYCHHDNRGIRHRAAIPEIETRNRSALKAAANKNSETQLVPNSCPVIILTIVTIVTIVTFLTFVILHQQLLYGSHQGTGVHFVGGAIVTIFNGTAAQGSLGWPQMSRLLHIFSGICGRLTVPAGVSGFCIICVMSEKFVAEIESS